LAAELRIGRPDLPRHFDDGGLIDVNTVPAQVLSRLPGLRPEEAESGGGRRSCQRSQRPEHPGRRSAGSASCQVWRFSGTTARRELALYRTLQHLHGGMALRSFC
jgi:hypothetical protein